MLLGCGGAGMRKGDDGGLGAGGSGGGLGATGGAVGADAGSAPISGGGAALSGDARIYDGVRSDSSSDARTLDSAQEACDVGPLWRAVAFAALSGHCGPDPAGLSYVVVDADGRVIHNAYYDGNPAGEQDWLALLGDARWPCLAGETIHYSCVAQ